VPTINATPGDPSANSYVSLDEALDFGDERAGADAWEDLESWQQERTLITASRAIDSLLLIGDKSSDTQALEFPRDGSDLIPSKVKQATMVLAFSYAPYYTAQNADQAAPDPVAAVPSNIKREKVDVLETEYFTPTAPSTMSDTWPREVLDLLRDWLRSTTAALWGSSQVVRAS
jgi:hypothetical protein